MSWQNEWKEVSGRILALTNAGAPLFTAVATQHDASHPVIRDVLLPAARDAFRDAREFVNKWDGKLPAALRTRLRDLMARAGKDELWTSNQGEKPVGLRSACLRIMTTLGVVRGEIEYIFGDPTQQAISITERAFKQLQWLIVADPNVASNWQRAFSQHETKCEHLGGAHLLHHGIWAYKAHHQKGRTDLVLGEAIGDGDALRGVARALVLTEWKRVQDVGQLNQDLRDAYKQARIYSGEMLAGFDLHNIRYVVLVSERRLPRVPLDLPDNSYVFRHINVAVRPENPSE